jgi:pteridine reductase
MDIIKLFGRLDYLINNASKFYPTKINEVTDKVWLDTIDTNIKTPLFLSKYFYNELKKRRGVIINIIDIHVEPPLKDHIIYNISKAGLLALTRTLAKDLAPKIRVNGVSPGAIMWPENESSNNKKLDILSKIPMKSTGEPADIAKTIYFLLEQSPYITGQNINVDGGRRLNM